MSKSILITGSEGYLGSVLVPFLLKKGFTITGLDTCFFTQFSLEKKNYKDHYKFIKSDVREIKENDLNNIDVVVHLAGISNDPMSRMDSKKVYDPTRIYTKIIHQNI